MKSKKHDVSIGADNPTPLDSINGSFFKQLDKNAKLPNKELSNQPPLIISEITR